MSSVTLNQTMSHIAACAAMLVVAAVGGLAVSGRTPALESPVALYDEQADHLWNRVHQVLFVRTSPDGARHGADRVDPLLWRESRHLVAGESHDRAVRVLNEFLAVNGERMIAQDLKRAVFQQDLWAVFDWLASSSSDRTPARMHLQQLVARVIRRVALTRTQIDAMNDRYTATAARQGIPAALADGGGAWVAIGGRQPVPLHIAELGRSSFLVLWSLPGGALDTRKYLQALWDVPDPFVVDPGFQRERDGETRVMLNPAMPAVPEGLRIALVRNMLLVDSAGEIVPSAIVQRIQLRTFPPHPTVAEWRLSREALFAGRSAGLRAVDHDDRDFITFSAHGFDPLEREPGRGTQALGRVLDGCSNCHHTLGARPLETIRSLHHMLRPNAFADPRHEPWSRWLTAPTTAAHEKRVTYEWGVLQGLWRLSHASRAVQQRPRYGCHRSARHEAAALTILFPQALWTVVFFTRRSTDCLSRLRHGKKGREMTVPMAKFENLDSATPGLDSLANGVAADAEERGLAVLLPAAIDRLCARRRERPTRPRKALGLG